MRFALTLCAIIFLSINIWASDNEEFRATWVITWEYMNAADDTAAAKARIRQILDNHQKANMNAVLWQARQSGTAYYNSSYEPWGYYAGYQNPGFDPLQFAVQEAHKRGLELHAWFNVFHTSSIHEGAPAAEHPEWVCRDGYGNPMPGSRALSPGLEEVRQYTLNVAMEIVRNYDIDGFHLDYIRWNEFDRFDFENNTIASSPPWHQLDGIFSKEKMKTLKTAAIEDRYLFDINHPYSAGIPDSPAGEPFSSWQEYWRWCVTEFVRTLHDSIQSVKPWVRLSPAALGRYNWDYWNGYHSVFQDAALWYNEGYIDQLTPMSYHWLSGSDFYGMLTGDGQRSWNPYIEQGINEGRLFTAGPGSYRLAEYSLWSRHKDIVKSSRNVKWVDGFQFFSYGSWEDFKYWETASNTFFQRKTKIRSLDYLHTEAPQAPQIMLDKIDSLNYRITVTPETSGDQDYWFCIYRSEDDTLEVLQDEIVHRHFGNSGFAYQDVFSGNQDFNGRYHYFATTLNRFWNESDLSNTMQTDSIPSFAPVVVTTFPGEDDTVKVNSNIQITFSKTMNTESISDYISIEPNIQFESVRLSDDHRVLKLKPETNFAFATDYILTLSDSLTDLNGKMLDGNNDGGESEPFVLNFRTKEADIDGPVIAYQKPMFNLDIQDVCVFAFDELIDEATISEATAYIEYNDAIVPSKAKVYTVDEYSVLGIQPEEPFKASKEYQVVLDTAIADIRGNRMESDRIAQIKIGAYGYIDTIMIDDFTSISDENWRDPDYSGQTTGTLAPRTTFTRSVEFYIPAATRESGQRTAGELHYEWDAEASDFFIREYLMPSSPEGQVTFDTTYNLQCYVFGDGSNNQFRFSLSEKNGDGYPLEVSNWMTIDWIGWKLVQWNLSDSNSVGSWLGNEVLDGSSYSFDSFQITKVSEQGSMKGSLYFQHLRAVKRVRIPVGIAQQDIGTPSTFKLSQNYPNPFNAQTRIDFTISKTADTKLVIYDVLGRKVATLLDKKTQPGNYSVYLNASELSTGMYVYVLSSGKHRVQKRMMLIK